MNKQYNILLEKIENEMLSVLPLKCDKNWIYKAVGNLNTNISIESSDIINKPANELIYRGGKRWRPMVLLLTSLCLDGDKTVSLILTPIVELIHNGTLLIDDIEDKATQRRGKKAVHLIYGDDMAINSGNHLYFIPTTIIDDLNISDSLKLRIYESYTQNMRRLHFGQGMDIQWHNDLYKIPTVEEYIQMCKFKTGCLASMSGELGAIAAGVDTALTEKIRIIWEEIGVGFQILDDIKNITTGNPGKLRGDDIVEGKKSLPVILYCNKHDNTKLLNNIDKAKKKGIKRGRKFVEKSISILEKSGVIEEANNIALKMLNDNIENLNTLLPNNNEKEILVNIVKSFVNSIISKE
ncbi:polyprenyl synthetase family protein [Thiospirochaeta perfilievii]|uniref:Polyprenyl synthetase family protein n=1 Tax=Thiospirochaeta perfilievii TaxID=252967 RepID=A0A5C1QDG7_9SPIO|nr:polyprenyl synthetase family protein [Thiospirochaeta perfilievii]QEN04774.1 polyprenyl synthetase family protein [Thiospirochaeta perfilievii]